MCHVRMDLLGLSVPDCIDMEYGCHMHKIELEIKSVHTCQERCCKRNIQLAYMSSLVLLLGGDVELNTRPRQNVVNDTSETTWECDSKNQPTTSENSVDYRLEMLSACQRSACRMKHLQNECLNWQG